MEYVATLIALAATCLGVCGDTHHRQRRGLRRITFVGYAALVLAAGACAVSMVTIRAVRSTEALRRTEAAEVLADTADQIVSAVTVMSARSKQPRKSKKQVSQELKDLLNQRGARLGDVIALYRDLLPDKARTVGWKLHVATTERADQAVTPSTAREYLRGIDALTRELDASLSLTQRRSPLSEIKLEDYTLDFNNLWPDLDLR
jgi:hypothetical protein